MKKILSFLVVLSVYAIGFCSGGDTLNYSTAVRTLADGDTFYADKHWGSLRDTTWRVINGRMGNVNLAADAFIAVTKLDSTGTLKSNKLKSDSLRLSSYAAVDSVNSVKGITSAAGIKGTTGTYTSTISADSVFSAKGMAASFFRGPLTGAVTATTVSASSNLNADSIYSTKGISSSATLNGTTAKLSNLTDGFIPVHTSDAAGLVNSPIYSDGTKFGNTATPQSTFDVRGQMSLYSGSVAYSDGQNIFFTSTANEGGGLNLHLGAAGAAPTSTTMKGMLRVRGSISGNGGNLYIGVFGGTVGEKTAIEIYNASASVAIVPTNGVVGIGQAPGTEKLEVTGNIKASGNVLADSVFSTKRINSRGYRVNGGTSIDTFETGSFSITFTGGFVENPTITCYYKKTNNFVTIYFGSIVGSSNSTIGTIVGTTGTEVPESIRPASSDRTCAVIMYSAAVVGGEIGRLTVGQYGYMTFYWLSGSSPGIMNKGVYGSSISYNR